MRKQGILKIVAFLLCVAVLVGIYNPTTYAASRTNRQAINDTLEIYLDSYELSEEKIIPGEDFTLTLVLKNADTTAAKKVVVDIYNPSGVAPVYGTISQEVVNVPAGGKAEVSFDYNSWETITTNTLDFQIALTADGMQNVNILRAPIGANSPFKIITTVVPNKAMAGQNVNCSMTFKLHDKEQVKDVVTKLNVNGMTMEVGNVGEIAQGTTKTQAMTTVFKNPGEYILEMFIDYVDESGTQQSALVSTGQITVLGENDGDISSIIGSDVFDGEIGSQIIDQTMQKQNSVKVLVVSGCLILLIFLVIVFLIKKKR